MPTEAAQMTQINIRIKAQTKTQAEKTLRLMGITPTQLVRTIYEKVAQGAEQCQETISAILNDATLKPCAEDTKWRTLMQGWDAGNGFLAQLESDSSTIPVDDRPWEQVYEEAMIAQYKSKGLL